MTRPLLASVVLALSAAGSALGQTRPLQTEEATAAAAGRIALEAGATVMAKEPNFQTESERTRSDVPTLDLVYSPRATWRSTWPGRAA